MAKELRVPKSQVPATQGRNIFEQYGDELGRGSNLIGKLLKFSKGDYLYGPDAEDMEDTELVAVVPAMVHGYQRWEEGQPAEQRMGSLIEGYVPPARSELGHVDESRWPTDANGKPRDPWQVTILLPMISIDGKVVYTFSTGSDGGRRHAIGLLCREYGEHIRTNPNELPIVQLDQDSYAHSDKSIGRVKFPTFPIVKWVKPDKYIAALADVTGRPVKMLAAE